MGLLNGVATILPLTLRTEQLSVKGIPLMLMIGMNNSALRRDLNLLV